jgi:hypothetical protein
MSAVFSQDLCRGSLLPRGGEASMGGLLLQAQLIDCLLLVRELCDHLVHVSLSRAAFIVLSRTLTLQCLDLNSPLLLQILPYVLDLAFCPCMAGPHVL